jgi:hypothetical protein
MMTPPKLETIPDSLARSAYRGISFSPEKRAESVKTGFIEQQNADWQYLYKYAKEWGAENALAAWWPTYISKLKTLEVDYLRSMSSVVSPMIAGPSKFPVARMQKANNAVDKRRNASLEGREKLLSNFLKQIKPSYLKPIRTGQEGAKSDLQKKLDQLVKNHQFMKDVNAILRKNKGNKDKQIQALKEYGVKDRLIDELLKPDFAGRTGIPQYALTNNLAEIKRLEGRVKEEEKLEVAKEEGGQEYVFDGGKLEANPTLNRWQIFFDEKPDSETRTKLKKRAFVWAPSQGAWQRQLNTTPLSRFDDVLPNLKKIENQQAEEVESKAIDQPDIPAPIISPVIEEEPVQPTTTQQPIITDRSDAQKIKNAVIEGELFLRAGTKNGKKLSSEELQAIENQVNRDRAKIGLPPFEMPAKNTGRFSEVKEIPRSQIFVDPNRFQGRVKDYSEETVRDIVARGNYDKTGEPIVVWEDPATDKYIVVSGHSRFEATRRLFEAGQKNLSTIPAKIFKGAQDDAIDYAVLESNRGSTEEGLTSDLMAYRRAVEQGRNKQYLQSIFKPDAKLRKLQQLYFLNPRGRWIELLADPEKARSFPYLERNATWIGQLRSALPAISDAHEAELFDFMYKSGKKNLSLDKEKFFNLIENRVNRIDFNPAEPLNLENQASSNAYTDPLNLELKEINREIERITGQMNKTIETIAQAKREGKTEVIPSLQNRVSEYQQMILRKIDEREKLRSQIGQLERAPMADLFSDTPELPAPAKPVAQPAQPAQPTTNNQKPTTKKTKTIQSDPVIKDTNLGVSEGGRIDEYWKRTGYEKLYGKWTERTDVTIQNVDQQAIATEYQLRGFEYGNWMNQQNRFDFLAATIYSLADMAKIMGTKNIGFDGTVGIGFGARGMGAANAHFEPGSFMINLTKMRGHGSFAHEYGHAIDYFFGTFVDQSKESRALTGGDTTATTFDIPEKNSLRYLAQKIVATYIWQGSGDEVFDGKEKTQSYLRLEDAKGDLVYWFRRNELFARAFEQYVQNKISAAGVKNTFLAKSKYEGVVYPTPEDAARIRPLFDQLIAELKKLDQ